MKKNIYILIALLLMATGCKKEKTVDYAKQVIGEWHCVPETFDADVYLALDPDGTFALYQQIGEGRHRHYSGEWELDGITLSGSYSGGEAWGSSYQVSFSGGNTMSLKALNGSEEVMTYSRNTIPSEVIEGSVEMKSDADIDCRPVL